MDFKRQTGGDSILGLAGRITYLVSIHKWFFPNPPVEDATGGEADKSLRLPCEMRSLFLWGYAQKIILGI